MKNLYKLLFTLLLLLQSTLVFAVIKDGRWHAGMGDPTLLGWITTIAYLLAIICSFRKARIIKAQGGTTRPWLLLAVLLFLLGINKQLDLQSWFTQVARDSAYANGWYEHRRVVQVAFIGALGFGMLMVLLSLRLFLANSWRYYKLVCVGIILLCLFVLIRAASFHHVDILIYYSILGIKINVILELSAIFLIIIGCIYHKKYIEPVTISNTLFGGYVEIARAGDNVRCPACSAQPLAAGRDGRLFKCRSCGFKFIVNVINY